MNKRLHSLIALVIAASFTFFCPPANAKLIPLTGGGNFSITAKKQDVKIAGQTVHAMIYEDDNAPLNVAVYPDGIPVLVMRLTVGDTVTCKLTNLLPDGEVPEGASIHWHGIELDNDSDGTAVTQDSVKNGQTYTYRFKVTRPGLFWFHSHMVPGDTLFAGMYGVIIAQTQCEKDMVSANKLPQDSRGYDSTNAAGTFTLALTDIEWDTRTQIIVSMITNADMSVTTNFAANPNLARVGRVSEDVFKTMNEWIHDCAANAKDNNACTAASSPGSITLVNGYNPDTTRDALTFAVKAGEIIRLRLYNEALTRTFYLKLDPTNTQQLVRIGGQGGLLDKARVEGGHNVIGSGGTGWDSFYDEGAISLSSGVRFDVVTTIPANAAVGTTNTLWGIKPAAGSPWPLTRNAVPAQYPIAYFKIVAGAPNNPPPIANGSNILSRGPCPAVEKLTVPTNEFVNPPPCGPGSGTNSRTIRLTKSAGSITNNPSIDNLDISKANPLDGNTGNGDWLTLPHLPTTRYARVGDLLQLSVRNETGGNPGSLTLAHPFHLHGFSLQPIKILDNCCTNPTSNLYTFDYNEFLDTIDVYGGQTLVFNVRLDDRPRMCDLATGPVLSACTENTPGGAVGRWLFHCHIASHGVLGMIGEVVVLDNSQANKWLQRPDVTSTGVDVLATSSTGSKTVADDFRCTSTGFITGVHVWGSWLGDIVDPNTTFELKFWTDVPAFGGRPSRPGWQIWEGLFPPGKYTNSLEAFVFPNESFYNPSQSNVIGFDTKVYRYDFTIPECSELFDSTNMQARGFFQTSNTIYWLSVTAYTTNALFGWKTCIPGDRFNDDASWSSTLYGPHWSDLHYPQGHSYYPMSMDMAFALDNAVTIPVGTNSPTLTVVLGPVLSAGLSDDKISITWTGGGILQYADEITGPWQDIDDATSPYQAPTDAPHRFYRVRMP